MNKEAQISIIIVDDHPVVSEGLNSLLQEKEHMKVVGTFTTGEATLDFLKDHYPEVILLDISLPDVNGVDLCRDIKEKYPNVRVLAISNHSERSIIAQMLQSGASGYLLKNSSVEELTRSIVNAVEGNPSLSPAVQAILTQGQGTVYKRPRLTRREKEVLKWVAEGLTTDQIAEKLYISPLTVETHRRNLMHKFGVKNTAALIKTAAEQALL